MGSDLTFRKIFAFWLPLAGAWLMMAAEGPFMAAIIARLPEPTENLAAFGVAAVLGYLLESPIIMLMSASAALVKNGSTYLSLRRFAYVLNGFLTFCVLVVIFPPVFNVLSGTLLGLPPKVAELTHVALVFLIPWPAAIGYRRFHQGLLIRDNKTRWVAYGTVFRLLAMGGTGFILSKVPAFSGAHVGAAGLAVGVVVEAFAARIMAHETVRGVLRQSGQEGAANVLVLLVTVFSIAVMWFVSRVTAGRF